MRDTSNPGFQKFTERNWQIVAELEAVAGEIGRPMAEVAVNWIANRPGVASVLVGATRVEQLRANLGALDFVLPAELAERLERASRPERQFPYSFFGPVIQSMIHGGKPVGSKPPGYRTEVLIESPAADLS